MRQLACHIELIHEASGELKDNTSFGFFWGGGDATLHRGEAASRGALHVGSEWCEAILKGGASWRCHWDLLVGYANGRGQWELFLSAKNAKRKTSIKSAERMARIYFA